MNRRQAFHFAARLAAFAAGGAVFARALHAQTSPTPPLQEIRIGTQKGGLLTAIKQRRLLEEVFGPQGVAIKWVDFAFGPPLVEAMNAGSIDYGYVGDSPPIFAQAGGAHILYVAAQQNSGETTAIVVPPDSSIKTLADLRGKKIGFAKGSSANNLLVAALEKAGVAYSDITPVALAPADATAAFVRGSIDAWSIWDPYLALAELKFSARPIAFDKDVHKTSNFFLANSDFVSKYPEVTGKLNDIAAAEGVWAQNHPAEVAQALSEATGVELPAERRYVDRVNFRVLPVDDEIIAGQQAIADRYARLGLIPKPVDVRAIVWKWTPNS